jgi:HSP20 family protein
MVPDRDLFANFERMRREIDELFGDAFGRGTLARHRRGGFTPPVDVSYADDPARVIVTVALPGVRLAELELEIRARELHLAGRRRPAESESRVYQQIEIEHGPFQRVIELGVDVVPERTQATLEDGMLHIELPLLERSRGGKAVAIPVAHRSEGGATGGSESRPGSARLDPGDGETA